MSENNIKAAIEALLFASDKPLSLEAMKETLDNLETGQIRQSLEELKSEYEGSHRGIRVIEIAGGFQMIASTNFTPFLKKLYKSRRAEKLSKPALETLSIIAYKQPVTRRQIESIRNVNTDRMIKVLLEKALIRIIARKKAPGRPHLFGTTRQFLQHFGLKSLEELPKLEGVKTAQVK